VLAVTLVAAAYLVYEGAAFVTATPQMRAEPALAPAAASHPLWMWGLGMIITGITLPLIFSRLAWPVAVTGCLLGIYVHVFFAIAYLDAYRHSHVGKAGLGAPAAVAVLLFLTVTAAFNEHYAAPRGLWARWNRS
jgi:hypothetical protein